jgi:rhodanese-related sulfurtransferase
MRNNLALLAAAIVATSAFTACKSTENKTISMKPGASMAQTAAPNDGINRISLAEARAAFAAGKAVIIDVRGEPSYKAGHIKGSQLIALGEIADRSGELPKDKTIILYCSCPAEQSSIAAVQTLKGKGVENTAALVGGYNGWKEAGYPIETSN